MSWRSSWPEVRRPASRWWESSSFVPWLILNTFRDVSGVVPEWPWSSGFMRKSSRRPNAPSMRFFVPLNSLDNLFVTLASIFSETWVIESSCDVGTFEFDAKLLLGCSSQFSLFKAANFFCCGLPFYGKAFSTINIWLSFYCKIKWEVYSISVRKIKNKWSIGKDWLNIVSTYQLQIIVHSFWRRFNTIAKSFRKGSEKLLKDY